MLLLDIINDWAKSLKAYVLGRGLLSLAVFATAGIASAFGYSLLWPAAAVAVGGTIFSVFMRAQREGVYEQGMVDLYREDIANQLGIAPDQVTRAHLKQAAKDNDVIDQALIRQRHKSWVSVATSALAGAATVGMIYAGILDLGKEFFSHLGALSGVAQFVSVGTVAGVSSLFLHNGLSLLIGHKTGLDKAAAHDRIVEMERGMGRGWGVSKQQVYSVLVAGNPALGQRIAQQYGKPYDAMSAPEQAKTLQAIGVADDMQAIATEINEGRLRPASLAYMMNEAMPRVNHPHHAPQETSHQPQRNHVAALGRAPREDVASYTARVDADRAMAATGRPR